MYFDDTFKSLIREHGKTFTELKTVLDQYSGDATIKKAMEGKRLSEELESYLIELLVYLSRLNREVDFRESEFVTILLQKNLTREAMRLPNGDASRERLLDPYLFTLIEMIDKTLAEAVVNSIEAIGLAFIAADSHSDIIEIKALTEIIFELRFALKSQAEKSQSVHQAAEKISPGTRSEEDLESILAELNRLIGLKQIKAEIAGLINLIKVRKLREEKGLPAMPMSFHLVFSGNPGTGKTTVARILSKIYKNLGVISKGELVEVDRSGLVAGYVGQTAIKVRKVIDSAKGGVLFIDEAYSLTSGGSQSDYGSEAIEVLLKAMEDQRGELVVIVAGYTNEMEAFLDSNPGLKSRFNKFIHFADYTPQELFDIFLLMCDKNGYRVPDDAKAALKDLITAVYDRRTKNFANARIIRNMFESAIQHQANRIIEIENPDRETLQEITLKDIEMLRETKWL